MMNAPECLTVWRSRIDTRDNMQYSILFTKLQCPGFFGGRQLWQLNRWRFLISAMACKNVSPRWHIFNARFSLEHMNWVPLNVLKVTYALLNFSASFACIGWAFICLLWLFLRGFKMTAFHLRSFSGDGGGGPEPVACSTPSNISSLHRKQLYIINHLTMKILFRANWKILCRFS